MSFTPQTTVTATPSIAVAGLVADSGFTSVLSRTLLGAVLPGRVVIGDAETAELPDSAGDITGDALGLVVYEPMSPPDSDGYPDGYTVGIMRSGYAWATTLSGAAVGAGDPVFVYRGATAADRGKVTQDSGAGSVTQLEGARFTGRTATGLAEVEFNGIGTGGGTYATVAGLASTSNGAGASLIGLEDAGAFTTAADVEAALAEIYQHLLTVQDDVTVPSFPTGGILAAGTPMAAWADNAGASAPGVTLANSECVGIRWNNFATQTAVWYRAHFPQRIDAGADVIMHVQASKVGATLADATTFTVTAFVQKAGTLHDADSNLGGATSAMIGDAASKTSQEVTLTLAAAEIPAAPFCLSFSIKPTDGTLGTDDVIVEDIWFEIKPAILAS